MWLIIPVFNKIIKIISNIFEEKYNTGKVSGDKL